MLSSQLLVATIGLTGYRKKLSCPTEIKWNKRPRDHHVLFLLPQRRIQVVCGIIPECPLMMCFCNISCQFFCNQNKLQLLNSFANDTELESKGLLNVLVVQLTINAAGNMFLSSLTGWVFLLFYLWLFKRVSRWSKSWKCFRWDIKHGEGRKREFCFPHPLITFLRCISRSPTWFQSTVQP